jgi:hypothetical protein
MSSLSPSTRQRGFALAAARARGARADVASLEREAEVLSRVPPAGLGRIDPSWFVAPPPSGRPEAARYLQRSAYARLVTMEPAGVLSSRTPAEIERVLVALGRRRVALAFVGAPRAGLAQLCARLGEPAASELVDEVRAVKAKSPSHDAVKAAQRALFRSRDGGEDSGARGFFFRVGCAWLAPALARDGDELQRAAQRLPRALGQQLLDEADAASSDGERASALALLADRPLATL